MPRAGTLLVGDIGGTNARFALFDGIGPRVNASQIVCRHTFAASNFPRFTDAIQAYMHAAGVTARQLRGASFAVACPVAGEDISFTNSTWSFSKDSVRFELGISRLTLINDFEALAYGVPGIAGENIAELRTGIGIERAPKVVVGPGTGLGVAGILPINFRDKETWIPAASEGGHIAFAPIDNFEFDLLNYMRARHDRISIERIVCGDGLALLHHFILIRSGEATSEPLSAAAITTKALAGDPHAKEAVMRFLAAAGSFAGDCALIYAARGGVYFGGGILPKLWSFVPDSPLIERFNAKGRMSHWIEKIPLKLILDDVVALRGAAIASECV